MSRFVPWDSELEFLNNYLSNQFVAVYKFWKTDESNGAIFVILAPPNKRAELVQNASWPLHIRDGIPSFSVYGGQEEKEAIYSPANDEGYLPLCFERDGGGIFATIPEPLQEFVLFHNLIPQDEGRKYLKLTESGDSVIAIEITTSDEVRIRTDLLLQFQAARQMDLVLQIDSVQFSTAEVGQVNEEVFKFEFSYFDRTPFGDDSNPGYRFLGKLFIPPADIFNSGIWPFELPLNIEGGFILRDEDGIARTALLRAQSRFDPNEYLRKIGFHYLELVQFDRNVLAKYLGNPDKYEVRDRLIKCGHLWSMSISDDGEKYVHTYLGDILRDLPPEEWAHWSKFNLTPDIPINSTTSPDELLNPGSEPLGLVQQFRATFADFQKRWNSKFGWYLFKPLGADDEYVFKTLKLPPGDSMQDFDTFILNMAKLLSDSINISHLVENEDIDSEMLGKSISGLQRWLQEKEFPSEKEVRDALHTIQWLRSKGAAHRKSSDFSAAVSKRYGYSAGRDFCEKLCNDARGLLLNLAEFFLTS